MWLPSCLPLWPQSPSSGATVGEPPERCGLRGWAGGGCPAVVQCCPGSATGHRDPLSREPPSFMPASYRCPSHSLTSSLHPSRRQAACHQLASSALSILLAPGQVFLTQVQAVGNALQPAGRPLLLGAPSPGLSVISRPAGDPVMTTPFLIDPSCWDLTLQGHFLLAPSLLMRSQLSAYSGLLYCPGQ